MSSRVVSEARWRCSGYDESNRRDFERRVGWRSPHAADGLANRDRDLARCTRDRDRPHLPSIPQSCWWAARGPSMSGAVRRSYAEEAVPIAASMLLAGAAAIPLGVIVLLRPGVTVFALAWLNGAYLLLAAVALTAAGRGVIGRRLAQFVSGGLVALAGVYAFVWPDATVRTMALLFGVAVVVVGVGTISAGWSLRRRLRASRLLIAAGFLGVQAGIVALLWPAVTVGILATLVGLYLVAYGIALTVAGWLVRQQAIWMRQCAHVRIAIAELQVRVERNNIEHVDRRFERSSTVHTGSDGQPRQPAPCRSR